VRKQALAMWAKLSDQRIDEIPLADDVHFVYLGDHQLVVDLHGAEAERAWLRDELFRRLPNLRFEVEDMIIEGGPWSTRVATRYAATRNGQAVYRGTNFGHIGWGNVVQDRMLPDTQALAAALA
jgi:predicted ester cyclase